MRELYGEEANYRPKLKFLQILNALLLLMETEHFTWLPTSSKTSQFTVLMF